MPVLELKQKDRHNNYQAVGSIEIKNQTEKSADLCFYGDINSESLGEWQKYYPDDKAPRDVQDFLSEIGEVERINIRINSGGGSVFGGIAIYNILKKHPAEKVVYIEGLAASIASVIAMVGDRIIIPENAQMMIHKPMSIARGDAEDFRKEAEVLDGCQKVILKTYMEKAKEGIDEESINEMINAETWKNGKEWQEYFNIEVTEQNLAVACRSEYFNGYRHLPEVLDERRKEQETKNKEQERQIKEILEDLDLI